MRCLLKRNVVAELKSPSCLSLWKPADMVCTFPLRFDFDLVKIFSFFENSRTRRLLRCDDGGKRVYIPEKAFLKHQTAGRRSPSSPPHSLSDFRLHFHSILRIGLDEAVLISVQKLGHCSSRGWTAHSAGTNKRAARTEKQIYTNLQTL